MDGRIRQKTKLKWQKNILCKILINELKILKIIISSTISVDFKRILVKSFKTSV